MGGKFQAAGKRRSSSALKPLWEWVHKGTPRWLGELLPAFCLFKGKPKGNQPKNRRATRMVFGGKPNASQPCLGEPEFETPNRTLQASPKSPVHRNRREVPEEFCQTPAQNQIDVLLNFLSRFFELILETNKDQTLIRKGSTPCSSLCLNWTFFHIFPPPPPPPAEHGTLFNSRCLCLAPFQPAKSWP